MFTDGVLTLLYLLILACTIYPPPEFISAGLTISNLFSRYLGNEHEDFIGYHLKSTILTLFIYSLSPLGYVIALLLFGDDEGLRTIFIGETGQLVKIMLTPCFIFPIVALTVYRSYEPGYEHHPITLNLRRFCNNNSNWRNIAASINAEFRSVEKFSLQANPISRIIVTENWILKVTPLNVYIAHQSDASLIVKEANTYSYSHLNVGMQEQFVNIEVGSSRANPFVIRLNSRDFRDLQDRVARSITVPAEFKIHKNIVEKFIDAFKEAVKENTAYVPTQELEMCLGCMQNTSNVKLQKMCDDELLNNCTSCYCKPMWCIECLGRWFAHRQDVAHPQTWLSAKCTCPMCRATFCVLDVCPINTE